MWVVDVETPVNARVYARILQLLSFWPLAIALSAAAQPAAPGVTDYSATNPEVIELEDITTALAVPRGSRIAPAAPPTVRLPIFFEFNSTVLQPDAEVLLDKVGAALASSQLEDYRFSIEGHTDSLGSRSYNARLSEERAEVVRTYLVEQGVPESRLGTVGHGEARPVASNGDEQGRQRNRRVEVINLGSTR